MSTESHVELTTTPEPDETTEAMVPFNIWRIFHLSTFQVGSAMGDILTAGVWNRILISDFGIPAWPVGLLIASRYFLAPISLWVGHRSDTLSLWGWHRTSYIWLGRGLMLLAIPLLGASTVMLGENTSDPLAWLVAFACFLLYGLGTLVSGSPYLALVRDSAPKSKQGIAIGIVETVLIALFPIVAIVFSRMLTIYNPALFWRLILFVMVVGGFFWWFSVSGAEKRNRRYGVGPEASSRIKLRETFEQIWDDGRTRLFFLFLFVSTFSAWLQDNILEPAAADIFGWQVDQTTRLTGYWGTATVIVLVASFIIWRNRRPEELSGITRTGLVIMALGMLTLVGSTYLLNTSLLLLGLIIFGAGFGFYTFGGLSLMAVMSPDPNAGAYLGLWTVAILVSKGLGTFMGGVVRDLLLAVQNSPAVAYGAVFALSAAGLLLAALIISRLDAIGFARETGRPGAV